MSADDFRKCAEDCLKRAEQARIERQKTILLEMAEAWLALAAQSRNSKR